MPFVENWWCEYISKLVEREAFIDSIRIQGAELENKFLFKVFTAVCASLV